MALGNTHCVICETFFGRDWCSTEVLFCCLSTEFQSRWPMWGRWIGMLFCKCRENRHLSPADCPQVDNRNLAGSCYYWYCFNTDTIQHKESFPESQDAWASSSILKEDWLIFILCVCAFCMLVYLCITFVQCPLGPEEGVRALGAGVTDNWEQPCRH